MSKIPVWIDCDTGVDDAAALLTANQLDNVQIVGLSTVAGNVPLDKTTVNTLKICDLMKKDYPVYMGADRPWIRPYVDASDVHGNDGLGGAPLPAPSRKPENKKAWDALYEEAVRQDGELVLVAIGPLTNVATALTLHPGLKDYLKKILIMGGAAVGGNRTASAEFNIYVDPDAAQTVFRCGKQITMFGLDVTQKAYVTAEEMDRIAEKVTPVTTFFKESMAPRMPFYEDLGIVGVCLHDVCPMLYLKYPEIFELEEAGVYVETQAELTLGKTVTDLFSDHQFEKKNAMVALRVDREAFFRHFSDALQSY